MLLQVQQMSTAPATEIVVGSVFDLIEWQYIYSIFYIFWVLVIYILLLIFSFYVITIFLVFAENKNNV